MEIELKISGVEIEVKGLQGLATLAGIGLALAAIVQELRRPPDERTWHGRVMGFVPYDFRPPTIQRIRDEFWNTESPEVLTPHAFGVGWGINLGGIAKKLDLVA
ncbi:MAG TPA: hypothetical protein VFC51_09360 [Chloroflexota bacterium]|nr:hypothetical protein [Chloroflexota bacterium]